MGCMNSRSHTLQKARSLAHSLRTSRTHGGGWSQHVDRDMVREQQEIFLIAQASHPRMF